MRSQNESLCYCHDVGLSVCPSISLPGMGVHCDHTEHFSADLSLWLDSPMFSALQHQRMSIYSRPTSTSFTWNRSGVWMCKLGLHINT